MYQPAIIMVAPNGARKTKKQHPALPITIEETVAEAARAAAEGATILHAHVRGERGEHVLDPGRYRELIAEMRAKVPRILVQITTEGVGRYGPREQAECVKAVRPKMISLAMREMAGEEQDLDYAREFYDWCRENDVHVQHIVYDEADLVRLFWLQDSGVIGNGRLCILYVLGRFLENRQATPEAIQVFNDVAAGRNPDWFVCAFGSQEHECALAAIQSGGHARVGFENNLLLQDGRVAGGSAELVAELKAAARDSGRPIAGNAQTREILGIR